MAIFVTAAVAAIGGAVWSKSSELVSWVGAVGSAMAGTAITVTALLAFQAIKENRFFEIATLTIGQTEAKHVYDAVDSLRPFYKTYNRDLDVARSEAIRLAALYSEGMLSRTILLSKDAATIVIMY